MPVRTPHDEPPLPTDAELSLLRILWRRGPSTVREVHGALPAGRSVGYTTVLKLLQIMRGKGLVARNEASRQHVYRAAVSERPTERRLVSDLMERAFAGSLSRLVLRALPEERATAAEVEEIRRLIDGLESERP